MLGCLTQIAFASGAFPIRTFVHLCGNETDREVSAQPFPNGWREGSEPVNEPGASERAARTRPIKAQSKAGLDAPASICNAEWAR